MLYELFPWVRRRPSLFALLIAGLLYLLGRYFEANGGTIPVLDAFTTYLKASLTAFDPWHIADIFYYELTGCRLSDMAVVCDPPPDMIDVLGGNGGSSLFATFLLAVVNSIAQIWVQSTWLGLVFYVVALVAAAMIIANAMGLAEEGPFGVIALIILTPALASLIMLALKWLLLLCAMLFSYSLAGIAWVLVLFGPFTFWLLAANTVLTNAHTIDNVIDAAGQPEAKKPSKEA